MFESEITLNEFNRHYLNVLLTDIPDDELDWQPHSGLHSVRWILAHLAIAVDYGFAQLGQPFVCPAEWHQAYGPGSQAGSSGDLRPSRDELLRVIHGGYAGLCEAARAATSDVTSVRHEVGLLSNTPLQTKGDVIAHILATHFAVHLGQLSTLRRLAGRPLLF
jgi:uncharacterized damage-inducible protein DinB